MLQKCLGCKEECEMSAPCPMMTGCAYADSVYPRNAEIWFNKDVLLDQDKIDSAKKLLKKRYSKEWEQEEH